MYEQLRPIIINELYSVVQNKELEQIMIKLDNIFNNYNISLKNTQLVPFKEQNLPYLIEMYLKIKLLEGLSELTIQNRSYLLKEFYYTIQKPVQKIEANDIRIFLYTYKEKHNCSNATLDTYRSMLSAFFTWLLKENFIQINPMDKINVIKSEIKQRDAFTLKQLNQLRENCKNIRDKAIIEFIFSSGARRSEVSNLNLTDILWDEVSEDGIVPIKLFGKGKKYRTSFISSNAAKLLKEYLKVRKVSSEKEALFLSCRAPYKRLSPRAIDDIFKYLSKKTDIKVCTPHILRHTMATFLLENGAPIQIIQILLGHSSLDTTRIYAKNSYTTIQKTYSDIFNKEEKLEFANI